VSGATRYARHGDQHIAFDVVGANGPDLLVLSFGVIPFQEMHEEPSLKRFQDRLAAFSRVIRFDRPGVGASDPIPVGTAPSPEGWAAAALDVLDAVGSTQASVFAPQESALEALVLAAKASDRIDRLVIVNGTSRLRRGADWPCGIPSAELDVVLASIEGAGAEEVDADVDVLGMIAPSVAGDPHFREWWQRTSSRGAGPASASAIISGTFEADVRGVLCDIQAPTLVLHRSDDTVLVAEHGRRLAESIPGARFVELDGADHMYWVGETDTMLGEIEEFLTGLRRGIKPNRALLTMLFVDIVESTRRLAEEGDESWRDELDRHDRAVRGAVERFDGRVVKSIGDGTLAEFSIPSNAVQCALAIRDASRADGLPIRAGLHVGEVELRGDDLAGMAVHVAARICAAAGPDEVLSSRTTIQLLSGAQLHLTNRVSQSLKGVPDLIDLVEIQPLAHPLVSSGECSGPNA
jgi:class 3 adenylate cyclase